MKHKSNGHHKPLSEKKTDSQKIVFPVTYELKAVMTNTTDDESNLAKLGAKLTEHQVDFKFQTKKKSSKGNYTSFTLRVTLLSKEQMDNLYEDLKKVEGLKFAV
jgi:hypothetical protein